MKVSAFDYELPPDRIAQTPARPRDAARLLVHELDAGLTRHRSVSELHEELAAGDLLVVNDTRVRPARLLGRRATGGGVELLLLDPAPGSRPEAEVWRALVRPAGRLRVDERVELAGGRVEARMIAREEDGAGTAGPVWSVALSEPGAPAATVVEILERHGRMPLPPYIRRTEGGDERDAGDRGDYQTLFAARSGAVAAPTAGLHFTPAVMRRLEDAGVECTSITLHVGLGTFLPVSVADTREHVMHHETYEVREETVEAVAACRARGGRIVAVGTTSVRVLETCATPRGGLRAGSGSTDLFIAPGYTFRLVDALLTNFHLPRSTLLMLVSAFAGRERTLGLYAEAVERGYRFYSYGDAMLLVGAARTERATPG